MIIDLQNQQAVAVSQDPAFILAPVSTPISALRTPKVHVILKTVLPLEAITHILSSHSKPVIYKAWKA